MNPRGSEPSDSRAALEPAHAPEPERGSSPPRPPPPDSVAAGAARRSLRSAPAAGTPKPEPPEDSRFDRWLPPGILTWLLVVAWVFVVGTSFTEHVLTARERAGILVHPDRRPRDAADEEAQAAVRREIRSSALSHLAFGIAGVVLLSMADSWIRRRDRDLARQRARMTAVFDASPDPLVLKDRELVYRSVNAAFAEFVGRPVDDLVGRTDFAVFPGEAAARYRDVDRRVLAAGTSETSEESLDLDGRPCHLQIVRTPIRDGRGALEGVLCSMRDITARRESEAALARRDAILSAARTAGERFLRGNSWFDIVPDVLANVGTSLDVSRAYLFENHETADGRVITSQRHEWTAPGTVPQLEDPRLQSADFRAHGLDRWMTLLGQGNPVCGSVDDLPPAEAAVLEAQDVRTVALVPIHTGTRWWGILGLDECRRKRAWLPAEVDALRVLAQMIGSCVDRQRIEAALRQSQKMEAVGQLAGGVAHDFNNNLTATLIQLGMLRELTADLPEALDLIQELEAGANRAAHLTRQLLLFSRKSVLQIIPLDLHELLADLLGLLRRLLGETIRLELRETPGLPPVEADASLLGQVVLNLCVNARDAMPRNGTLTLATRVVEFTPEQSRIRADAYPGTFVCLSVSDTGTGIAPGVLPHIFEPFFTTKEVGKGTGLGLATVHGIVTQHRGWVEVDSAVDQGSTFRVFLPVAPRPPSGPLPAAPPCSPRGTETLLLVEDEPDVRAAVARCLRRWGYEVLEAGTAREALALWSSHSRSIALLFTDLVLPGGMSGHELARHLLREQPGLRVVLSSGYSPDSLPDSAPEVPPFARFPKPYDLDALAAEIRRLLDRPPPGPGPAGG